MATQPRLLVLSQLFPSDAQPGAGVFIRERMFRVARHLPIVVVAPQAWFPLQGLVRRFRPHFRPPAPRFEIMQGIEVHRPRFLCFPGVLKWTDGWFLALCSLLTIRRLVRKHRLNILDVHFGYPDGYAGVLLGRWLRLPVVMTLRGKEERQARTRVAAPLRHAIVRADRLVCVSEALKEVALGLGAESNRITVIGNGIDLSKFAPISRRLSREALGLPLEAKVIVSVGTLVERKGFHRVIECLPALLGRHPNLVYLIVGGPGPEGDISAQLRRQVEALGLTQRVRFLGPYAPERLKIPLSAADLFVLATGYEGWANVFLEAMACGLPVVTTRVGGNAQVVNSPKLGRLIEYGDREALTEAIGAALDGEWDREHIMQHACANAWERRIPPLLEVFHQLLECRTIPERRLKILYHHRTASRDGQAVHIEEMVEALRHIGCEVIVVQPPATARIRFGADARSASALRRLLPKAASELLELAYSWIAYRRLKRAYLEHRPDVLYERHNLYLLAGKWLKWRFKLPYLLEVNSPLTLERMRHGGLALPWLARRLEVGVWKAADVLLPVSHVLADILVQHGVPRERMRVIPNGIDLRAFDAAPSRDEAKKRLGLEGRLILGFTGFVRPWHGLEQVIDFIAEARRPELMLLVAGDGPARAALAEHAARRGVAQQIRFAGLVERERIPSFVAAFDIALQPAATPYASPLKLFEYLAAGCPVIAPFQPNIAEVLVDGENGILFAPDEPGALANAIAHLVADGVLRERLGIAARATILQRRFTWSGNAERVVQEAHRLMTASTQTADLPGVQDQQAS